MKKIFKTFICVIIVLSSYSQNTDTFNLITNYLGDSTNSVEKITGMAKLDTTYVLAISGHTDSTYWDLLIVEIDKQGNALQKYYHLKSVSLYIDNRLSVIYY